MAYGTLWINVASFEIATETVSSQYLQGAEEHEMTQLVEEIITVYGFIFT